MRQTDIKPRADKPAASIEPQRRLPENAGHVVPEALIMKNPFETLVIPGGILLLSFLSALLLPAPAFSVALTKAIMATLPVQDLNQLYTIVFCIWFLLLGTLEFFVIRFVWRRWFQV